MGTSNGYGMPTGGDWTPLKIAATSFVKDIGQGSVTPKNLLGNYLQANGGAQAMAQGRGGISGRGSGWYQIGSSAKKTGTKFGGFLSGVAAKGLDATLKDAGLVHLIGKPATEVCAGLLEAFTSAANTLDDHATRTALSNILTDLFNPDASYEDIEQLLNQAIDDKGLMTVMGNFFGYYLYELFCRDFYEVWQKKVGAEQTRRSLHQVKKCIFADVESKLVKKDIHSFDWSGPEGASLVEQVMQDTLEIFEVV